jgi:putative glycosyltransferase (TIGR04372 family)
VEGGHCFVLEIPLSGEDESGDRVPAVTYSRMIKGLIAEGSLTQAAEVGEKAVSTYPGDLDLINRLLHVYRVQERHADALALTASIPVASIAPKQLMFVAFAAERRGEFNRASELFFEAFKHKASLPVLKALVRVLNLSDRKLEKPVFEHVISRHGDDVAMVRLASVLSKGQAASENAPHRQFLTAVANGRVDETIELGRALMDAADRPPATAELLKSALFAAGRIEEALALAPTVAGEQKFDEFARTLVRPIPRGGWFIHLASFPALGDFFVRLALLSRLKQSGRASFITLIYRNDGEFKQHFKAFCPYVDEWVECDTVSLAALQDRYGPAELSRATILMPNTLHPRMVEATNLPTFRVPASQEKQLSERLLAAGVATDRWIATMHYRQGSSAPRSDPDERRDVHAENFHRLADHIIDELGGQVIRIGHPGMDPAPSREGYFDLARAPVDLQLYAVARSRFMMGTDSGMVSFGLGFGIPTGRTNVVYDTWLEGPEDIILLRNLVGQNARAISMEHLFSEQSIRLEAFSPGAGYHLFENTVEQLCEVSDRLHRRTADIGAWRPLPPPVESGPDAPVGRPSEIVDLTGLLGVPADVVDPDIQSG